MKYRKRIALIALLLAVALLGACGDKKADAPPLPCKAERVEFAEDNARWMQQLAADFSAIYEIGWGEYQADLVVETYEEGVPAEIGGIYAIDTALAELPDGKDAPYFALMLRAKIGDPASRQEVLIGQQGATYTCPLGDLIEGGRYAAFTSNWEYDEADFVSGAKLPLFCVSFSEQNAVRAAGDVETALSYERAVLFSLRLK